MSVKLYILMIFLIVYGVVTVPLLAMHGEGRNQNDLKLNQNKRNRDICKAVPHHRLIEKMAEAAYNFRGDKLTRYSNQLLATKSREAFSEAAAILEAYGWRPVRVLRALFKKELREMGVDAW